MSKYKIPNQKYSFEFIDAMKQIKYIDRVPDM